MHVMLLADMQKVIQAQQVFLFKMKTIINEEFDKRQVGHATFQVQKQVETMLSTFQDKIIKKVDALGTDKSTYNGDGTYKNQVPFGRCDHGGRWFFWEGIYRRVPEDWVFPNKMTLRTAWHRYFLCDHESGVCPLKYLTASDMKKQSNGRRNISNLKMLMNFMTDKCREKGIFVDKPNEKELDSMYRSVAGDILSLSNNPRSETFSWHTHVRNVNKEIKRRKNDSTSN